MARWVSFVARLNSRRLGGRPSFLAHLRIAAMMSFLDRSHLTVVSQKTLTLCFAKDGAPSKGWAPKAAPIDSRRIRSTTSKDGVFRWSLNRGFSNFFYFTLRNSAGFGEDGRDVLRKAMGLAALETRGQVLPSRQDSFRPIAESCASVRDGESRRKLH